MKWACYCSSPSTTRCTPRISCCSGPTGPHPARPLRITCNPMVELGCHLMWSTAPERPRAFACRCCYGNEKLWRHFNGHGGGDEDTPTALVQRFASSLGLLISSESRRDGEGCRNK